MKIFHLICFCCLINFSWAIADRIGCRDESGNLIDWFYLYKLPNKFSDRSSSGLEYLFITPNSQSTWSLSSNLINSTASFPGQTLSFIYTQKIDDYLVAMYNDEPTNGKVDNARGHTKGVVVANDISGFWLVHSVPKFPPALGEHYDYPHSGSIYGQSFLCMSFTGDQMDIVGNQLQFNEPTFYSTQVPEFLETLYPHLVEATKMHAKTNAPFHNAATLRSRYGTVFTSFAKSGSFRKELYEDLVAPHYQPGDFYVESWRHGPGNIDSNCTRATKIYNVKDVTVKGENITFTTLHDHSKWMVSAMNKLICVGDINRQEHQKVRGGGTVCMQNDKISMVYQEAVAEVEECKKEVEDVEVFIRFIGNEV